MMWIWIINALLHSASANDDVEKPPIFDQERIEATESAAPKQNDVKTARKRFENAVKTLFRARGVAKCKY